MMLCLLFPPMIQADATIVAPADKAVASALARDLADDDYWLRLVHYQRTSQGYESQADDPRFFLSPNGAVSPKSELTATLKAFFDTGEGGDDHAQCRFPARLYWLDKVLGLRSLGLPKVHCRALNQWLRELDIGHATLVFPSAYLNGPSSMFGHTLLRLTPSDYRKDSPMAAYALNYAANVNPNDNALAYSFKGLFGGYPGLFSIVPYYQKIKEYNDIESRDIWEYDLNLNQTEVDQLMRHTWELKDIRFDYYFFTENCSYHVLSLLDVARPGSRLTDGFSIKAIPSDTVRTVVDSGFTDRVTYRPANTTVIRRHLGAIAPADRTRVLKLASGTAPAQISGFGGLSEKERSRILELAYDYRRYRALNDPESEYGSDSAPDYRLLKQRSRLPIGSVWPPIRRPAYQPDQGHLTSRLAIGIGDYDHEFYTRFKYRPAYHDILDPLEGYTMGAQINFFDVDLGYAPSRHRPRLNRLTVIDILSLTPRDGFFKPLSWGINTGIERMKTRYGWTTGPQVSGVVGVSYLMDRRWLGYFLVPAALRVGDGFSDGYTAGAGVSIGALLYLRHSTAELSLTGLRYFAGDRDTQAGLRWRQHFTITPRYGLRIQAERRRLYGHYGNQFDVALHCYL